MRCEKPTACRQKLQNSRFRYNMRMYMPGTRSFKSCFGRTIFLALHNTA